MQLFTLAVTVLCSILHISTLLLKLPSHFDILVYIFLNTVFYEGSEIHSHPLLCSTLMHKVNILFWQASLCNSMLGIIPSYLRGRFLMKCH